MQFLKADWQRAEFKREWTVKEKRKEFLNVIRIRKAAQATERRDAARAGNTPGAAEKTAEGPQESHTARNKDPRKLDTFRRATAPARMTLTPDTKRHRPKRLQPEATAANGDGRRPRPAKILQAEGPRRRTRSRRADPARAAPHLLIFTELILERRRTRGESWTASAGNTRGRSSKNGTHYI